MDLICRICLSTAVTKDISKLKVGKKKESETYSEILEFCLSIRVTENPQAPNKLCTKCYKKVVAYHKFKTLALKNDAYFKSHQRNSYVKLEVIESDDIYNNNNGQDLSDESDNEANRQELEPEIEVKLENGIQELDSDDELLSVIKKIKSESPSDDVKLEEETGINMIQEQKVEEIQKKPILPKKQGRKKREKKPITITRQICGECGKSVVDIKAHMLVHTPKSERKGYPCKHCHRVFYSYGARRSHTNFKHLGKKSRCEVCGKDFTCLKMHMLTMHNRDAMPFTCLICNYKFKYQTVLDQHMMIHTKEKPFECDQCDKTFRIKMLLKSHQRAVHLKEKSHLCQFCSKTFFKKYHLQVHLRSHTKEKPYKCEECGVGFASTDSLRYHRTIHSKEKNYHCDHCDMSFSRANNLRSHMVTHTKEKRFACKYCGLHFYRSDHRKRHQFTAHEKHQPNSAAL